MNPSERKKQTHLRCERQRREAINSGYNSLKELLPASSSFVGCKTTNAAILFRAAEYVKVLNDSIAKSEEDLSKLRTQYSALELIMQQYENFSMESQPFTALQIQMLQGFLDACFESFVNHVDASSYQAITRSLLMWIEQLDFQALRMNESRRRRPYSSGKALINGEMLEELCVVCGDRASGYHYNALTCEGCKGFFRRSINRKAIYYCKFGQECEIDLYMRRKCQFCRLAKCIQSGMRAELVIPEEQCRIKREEKQRVKLGTSNLTSSELVSSSSQPPRPALTSEAEELIQRLVELDQEYLIIPDDISQLLENDVVQLQEDPSPFERFIEIVTLNLELIYEFISLLPGFSLIEANDQKILQNECATELLLLRMARYYDPKTESIKLSNGNFTWSYGKQTFQKLAMERLSVQLFVFANSLASMGLNEIEYALLSALVVLTNRKGLSNPLAILEICEIYITGLQAYEELIHPLHPYAFSQLVLKLAELSALASETV